MNDTKPNGNGNGLKITPGLVKMIFGVVVVAVLGFLWLTTELGAKADQTKVDQLEREVKAEVSQVEKELVGVQLTLAKMNAKLDLLLDK